MSYGVPVTFIAENGDQPASQLDQCFTAVLLGVNNAYLRGVLGARPAPDGIGNGRFYFATDTQQMFFDNGTAWLPIAPAVSAVSIGLYSVRGLRGVNNPGTPNTKFDFDMDAVSVFDPATFAVTPLLGVGTQTCDITLAGPVINGRDQAGAFANSSWVYFYEIFNPTTVTQALIASANPWPTGPAALPAGYTRWAPLHAVFLSGGGALTPLVIRGKNASFKAAPNVFNGLSGTAENTQAIPTLVPPNAEEFWLDWAWFGAAGEGPSFKWAAGNNYAPYLSVTTGIQEAQTRVPNVGQQFLWQVTANSRPTVINLDSYSVSNGAC